MKRSFRDKVRYFLKYQIMTPFKVIYYFFYFLRYPFWQPRNGWSGKKLWTFSEYSQIPKGWRKAFGKQLTKDLKKQLKKDNQLKDFYFLDIKQKWGYLRLYPCATTAKVFELLDYYENLSIQYCEFCGKPSRYYIDWGYHCYVCSDCFNEQLVDCTKKEIYNAKRRCRLKDK